MIAEWSFDDGSVTASSRRAARLLIMSASPPYSNKSLLGRTDLRRSSARNSRTAVRRSAAAGWGTAVPAVRWEDLLAAFPATAGERSAAGCHANSGVAHRDRV
jgi:hypothetical protein